MYKPDNYPTLRNFAKKTFFSNQVKKWKNKASKNKSRDSLDQSTLPSSIQSTPSKTGNGRQPLKADGKLTGVKSAESKSKISPLQQYMIEQAKLSGYRYDISWIQMLFFASYYRRQFSVDIKVINYKIKTFCKTGGAEVQG